jgi:curli biogenesis system outer membrane secretion channel CsgG
MPQPTFLRIVRIDIRANAETLHQHYYSMRRREMKRKYYLLGSLLITLAILLTSCANSVKSYSKPDLRIEKGKMGILPFSSNIPEVGNVVSDIVGAHLLAAGFDIIDRSHMAQLLEEENVSYLEVDSPDYKKIGAITMVNFVLVGNIAFSSATTRVVDTTTGKTLIVTVFQPNKITGSASAVDVGNKLAKSLVNKLNKSIKP